MVIVLKILGIVLTIAVLVFIYSLVRVAGMSERMIEQIHEEESEGIS